MTALLLFGIGLLGIMALHVLARKGNNDAQAVTAASSIGEFWMERLRTESTMWNVGPSDLTATAAPMLSNIGGGVSTAGATTGWIAPPGNPLLSRDTQEREIVTGGTPTPSGEYCTQYRLTTLIPDQVLRAEVRIMWWKEGVARPSNWNTCPAPTGPGGNPDITQLHVIALSSTLWRNPL
jgi:hypothetical protein